MFGALLTTFFFVFLMFECPSILLNIHSISFYYLLWLSLNEYLAPLSLLYTEICVCTQIHVYKYMYICMYIALKFLTNLYILILIKNTYFYYSHKSWVMKIFCVYNIIIIHCSMQIIWFINKLHVNVIQWKSHFPFYGVIKVKRCCAAGDDDNGLCAHPLFLTIV